MVQLVGGEQIVANDRFEFVWAGIGERFDGDCSDVSEDTGWLLRVAGIDTAVDDIRGDDVVDSALGTQDAMIVVVEGEDFSGTQIRSAPFGPGCAIVGRCCAVSRSWDEVTG